MLVRKNKQTNKQTKHHSLFLNDIILLERLYI